MKKFAFLIHPRTAEDLGRRAGKMLRIGERLGMKLLPNALFEKCIKYLRGRAGFTVCSHFKVNDEVEGYIIAVLLTAKQMKENRLLAKNRIIDAVLYAQDKLGVERVGLGAYTAPITNDGKAIVNDPRVKISVTHGDALSAMSAIPAAKQAAVLKGKNIKESTVAVVGAYGIVGRPVSILFSELEPRKIILTGPSFNRLKIVKKEISDFSQTKVEINVDNGAVKEADIVILCTTANGTIVDENTLKKDAIVIDMAQPHNMGKETCDLRPDVLRIDGGYMSIPNINLRFKMGPPKFTTFACLTETIVSTLIGDIEDHVGQVKVDFAKIIYTKAEELGYGLAPLTCFSKPIFETGLKKIQEPKLRRLAIFARTFGLL